MPRANNPTLGTINCNECGSVADVKKANGNRNRYLYTICPKCGTDQRSGAMVQARIWSGTSWREGLKPETAPPNLPEPASAEPAQPEDQKTQEPAQEPVKPKKEPSGASGMLLAACLVAPLLFILKGGGVMTEAAIDNLSALEREAESQEQESAALEAELMDDKAGELLSKQIEVEAIKGAAFAVGAVETVLKMKWKYVAISPDHKTQIVEKGAAVIKKYDCTLPEWLQPYQEEVELGMVIASAGFGIYAQIANHKEQEAKKAEAEKKGADNGDAVQATESQHSA